MNKSLRSISSALLLVGLLATASCRALEPSHSPDHPGGIIGEMHWLAGTWSGDMWGGRFVAHYSTPAGGKILSHSRLFEGDEVSFYEFEVFEPKASTVYFQPYPGGEAATGFTLVSHDAKSRRAIFENPNKDFPTRIVYERVADDRLVITLSDPHGDSSEIQTFDLSR